MRSLRTSRTARDAIRRLRDDPGRLPGRSFTSAAAAPSPPGGSLLAGGPCVASYNVHKCVGRDGKFDPARVAAVIAELGADVVAVQEADRRFGRRSGLLDAAALRSESGLTLLRVSDLPDGHGWHGNAILVRDETGEVARTAKLRRLKLPGAEPRGAVVAELHLPGGRLRVVAAHFGLLRRCRTRQAAVVLEAVAQGEPMPTLLMGDLNEWRPSRFSALRGLEPVFGPVGGAPRSFPAQRPVFSLDRILGWPRGLVGEVEAHDSLLARLASDHLPLRARLDLSVVGAAPMADAA